MSEWEAGEGDTSQAVCGLKFHMKDLSLHPQSSGGLWSVKWWDQKGGFGFGPFIRLFIHLANMTLTCSVLASVYSSPWSHRLVLKCSAPVLPPPGSLSDPEDESPLFCDPTGTLGGPLHCHHWFMCRAHLTTLLCCFLGPWMLQDSQRDQKY